jgi:hypothetical protein
VAVSRTLGAPSAPRGQRSGSKDPKASRSCNATATNAEHGKVEAAEPLQRLRFLHSTVAFHAVPTLALASKGLATSSNRITWTDDHFPPRAAGIPRSSGPAAMARRDSQPAACSSHCPGACPPLYSRSTGRPGFRRQSSTTIATELHATPLGSSHAPSACATLSPCPPDDA